MRLFFPLSAVAMLLVSVSRSVSAGEAASAQPYEKIRYPSFDGELGSGNGRLISLLEADQAEAYELSAGTPRVNLRNIVITLYDDSEEARKTVGDDDELPVEMTIRSDRGFFTRRPSEDPGAESMEDVVTLEGDVQVKRYFTPSNNGPGAGARPGRMPENVQTEIYCEYAQWNNKYGKLNGDGDVRLVQEDNRIYGTGFLYLADEEAFASGERRKDPRAWGGIIFIEHNARMEIDRVLADGSLDQTVITCRDTASYKLVEKEVQFEREVRVARSGMTIDCDILKVFMRHEDDSGPEGGGDDRLPGTVKSIVATIGSRPGAVVITGYDVNEQGVNGDILYVARGGRADYGYDENRITLTDLRNDRIPEVEFGMDRISDRMLDFTFSEGGGKGSSALSGGIGAITLNSLQTRGGQGRVFLRPREGATGEAALPVEIVYKGEMRFSGGDNLIRFTDSVFLKRGFADSTSLRREGLTIRSESLDVRLRAGDADHARIERVVAEDNVLINASGRQASAQRAEYDMDDVKGEDTLRLYGPPSNTPPHPWVSDDEGNRIAAPTIVMRRLSGNRARPRHLLRAYDGTVTCDFVTKAASVAERNKVFSVKCEKVMEYNESDGIAWFDGQVQATSDAPEDNYVLTSDKLIIYLTEKPDPDDPEKAIVRPRRVDANGNAVLRQDTRICEAGQIIRDFPTEQLDEGDIYLEGFAGDALNPPKPAVYRDQEGERILSLFEAPRIKASATGNLVQANGPGRLSTPDETPGARAEIEFAGAARYESFQGGLVSEAKFRRGVMMRQPSRNLVIAADEVDATFFQESPDRGIDPGESTVAAIERIGKLRKTEARTGVRVEHGLPRRGRRVATGDKGVVEFTETGNVITLTVDRRLGDQRWVMARDHDGMTLWSTQIEVREAQGVTRAAGPGEIQIPGDPKSDGLNKIPTRIAYGERGMLVYNEIALNIRAVDNVRILQPSAATGSWQHPTLDGRCDQLDITLAEPPAAGDVESSDDALSKVLRMDAVGGVLLRVFAEPAPGQPESDWFNRPGTTFFTRGDQAVYDVPAGRITMSALPGRQPQLLLNLVDPGSTPRRQRLRADRFVLNANAVPRRWFFEGQLDSSTLQPGEPFDFLD
ncbi:MAG: hypothetical protein LBT97_02085 [Planctomycetota bacterium]|jgi:lipopolysaccharide export system protein LptA|nr:hypothetical protein [Planctomycetota bacterium]